MALYLVQHAKALSAQEDPERGISDQGRSEVERIASVAKGYGVRVRKIVHSDKKRARQTAEILAHFLEPSSVEPASGLHPQDDVTALAVALRAEDDWMLVGHMPFLSKLASHLVIGRPEPAIFAFQNGGIVCLDEVAGTESWIIKWALMPTVG